MGRLARRARLTAFAGVAGLLLLFAWTPADAQAPPTAPTFTTGTVVVKRATGQVEVQRGGQGSWAAIGVGGRLNEGDHIRALAGASADLQYPDGSTVLLAENTRLVMIKLDYNPTTRGRNIATHVVVGKIKAEVTRAAVELVRARQANFHISTPVGVAAVRGTVVFISFNPVTNQVFVAVSPSPGQPPVQATVTLIGFGPPGAPPVVVTISGGQFTTKVGAAPASAPAPIQTLPATVQGGLGSPSNPATSNNPNLSGTVIVNTAQILQVIVSTPPPEPPPPIVPTGPPVTPPCTGHSC